MKPYIQPFERALALEELTALTRSEPIPVDDLADRALLFAVPTAARTSELARTLAYWEVVDTDNPRLTTQVLRERTATVLRNGVPTKDIPSLLAANEATLPNRRCLRYGTHGIHEYRGKFFPQLVRALINIGCVPSDGLVADPMCGSGTTCVESILSGHHALGLDMNPLSVLMANAKCSLLSVAPDALESAYERIRRQLMRPGGKRNGRLIYWETLSASDRDYLSRWFSEQVLRDLDEVARAVQFSEGRIRDFMWLCLSNILRSVSWQKDDDLRVRREVRLDVEIDPIREFLEELGRSVRVVLAFLYDNKDSRFGPFDVSEGDARDIGAKWRQWKGKIDAIITSPPYATALPYLDTDRLSLCYLGLLQRPGHRERDQRMIGNREITERQRLHYWELFKRSKNRFPRSVSALIQRVESLNSRTEVGFRRRNLPALLTKYFSDMTQVFEGMISVLRRGSPAYVVIGNNHTIAGGTRVEIATASLLVDIASSLNIRCERRVPMEMLVSRDLRHPLISGL
jgi:site-specific DNA-methyltransferase (cytosine-N4-specific)